MKKLGAFVFLLVLLVSSFVSAQSVDGSFGGILNSVSSGAGTFYDSILEPFAKFFLGRNTETGEILFAKLLIFGILVMAAWLSLRQFPPLQGRTNMALVLSALASVLAVRYITAEWINVIILPYGTVAIALTSIIPLIGFFFFIERGVRNNKILRKFSWMLLAVVYLGLYLYRGLELIPTANGFNPGVIYLFASLGCIVLLILDNTIQNAFLRAYHSNRASRNVSSRKFDLDVKYDKVIDEFLNLSAPTDVQKNSANLKIDSINAHARSLGLPEYQRLA